MFESSLRRAQWHSRIWRIAAFNTGLSIVCWIVAQWAPFIMAVFAVPGIMLAAWVAFHSEMERGAVVYYFRYLEWQSPPLTWQEIISAWAGAAAFVIAGLAVLARLIEFSAPTVWVLVSLLSLCALGWSVRSQFHLADLWRGKQRSLTDEQITLLKKLEPVLGWRVLVEGR